MYENYQTLRIEPEGRVVRITLNRPDRRNATDPAMHAELERVFHELRDDPLADIVVLTGAGEAFSAGGDINNIARSLDDQERWAEAMREARALLVNMVSLDRVVLGRINGHAIGLGATLALFCDIAICAEHAKIADPHVKIGLSPGDGGALIWPLLVGHARAKRYLFTGQSITGAKAAEIGLVTEAAPLTELDARVEAILAELLATPSHALRAAKRTTNLFLLQQIEAVIDQHLAIETETHLSLEHRALVTAMRQHKAS